MLATRMSPATILRSGLFVLVTTFVVVLFFTAESDRHTDDLNQSKINQMSMMLVANDAIKQEPHQSKEKVTTLSYSEMNMQLKERLSSANQDKLQRVIAAERALFSDMPIEPNAQKEWLNALQLEAFLQAIETQESIKEASAPLTVMKNPLLMTGFFIIAISLFVVGFGFGRMRASALVFSVRDLSYKKESEHFMQRRD